MNVLSDPGIAIYVSLAVALAVWVGVFAYLWRLDAATKDLRRRLERQPEQDTIPIPKATLERRSGEQGGTAPGSEQSREPRAEAQR